MYATVTSFLDLAALYYLAEQDASEGTYSLN